jgi:MoxR-like ATPase
MSAIAAALSQIDRVAAEGDLAPDPAEPLELATPSEPILLPDGKRIYPPCLHGQPIDQLAVALLDMHDPAKSTFLRLIGPPGAGKSQIARAIADRLWTGRGRQVADRHGAPFYGFVELHPGPSSDEFFFRYDYVPVAGAGGQVALVDSAFVQAMREGWVVMIDEVNTARDVALLSINATLDGRLTLYLAATGETVVARPGFAVLLAYNPGLVGATDIPDAWHSRFPATRPREGVAGRTRTGVAGITTRSNEVLASAAAPHASKLRRHELHPPAEVVRVVCLAKRSSTASVTA